MKCPKCQFENPQRVKFCVHCGGRLETICAKCGARNSPTFNFCGECGYNLGQPTSSAAIPPREDFTKFPDSPPQKVTPAAIPAEGERKHVTVLFSDLAGYTAMSEKLDPEDVKEITSRIFGEISKIVANYDGFVEKYAGDAVMALFGATVSHEDDPVRAINAAREIHHIVDSLSPRYEETIEHPLSMHTGINTGLVVTGEINFEQGTHGVAGDTINVAARLSGLGEAGEILVSRDTFSQSEGLFDFEDLGPLNLKGKSEPVQVYKVLAPKTEPVKIHRLHGLRADLIGRIVEMDLLAEAARKLQDGQGAVLAICGTAGTGKSRLIEEFRSTLKLEKVQWLEGHAYPFTQSMPYYPLINLLSRSLRIEETDSPHTVREKIETGLSHLLGQDSEFVHIIGTLYALSIPEIDEIDPEYWKPQLHKAVRIILSALSRQAPTIVYLEDLHWADPSFLELIRRLLMESGDPILFICNYRPVISLFSSHQIKSMANPYREIRLQDLSPTESQGMMESLLKTDNVPTELKHFLHDKVAGNPFYVEEMINSMIESGTLVHDDDFWRVAAPITDFGISSTIHGVIAGRLDRLEKEAKQIIQEASVIGRAFLYRLLKKISRLQNHIDPSLRIFERLDLIRARSIQPDLEYVFKHALTQEVVYNGLLKTERRKIHERIGLVMEQVFADRLAEFYETLAYHFTQARSVHKAVDYLVKAGEKSFKRYALEESDRYFKESFSLLTEKSGLTATDKALLIDILIKWAYVFYYRGDFKGMVELFRQNEQTAGELNDKTRRGFFYAWLGMALWMRQDLKKSEHYLREALDLGRTADDQRLISYACSGLSMACSDLGLFEEALELAERGHEIARQLKADHYLYFKSLHARGLAYYYLGNCEENHKIGKILLDYGNKHSNLRCLVLGYMSVSLAHSAAGNHALALKAGKDAVRISADPLYAIIPNALIALSHFQMGEFEEAAKIAHATLAFSDKFGCEYHGSIASLILDGIMIANGKMALGLNRIQDTLQRFRDIERKSFIPTVECILGNIYSQIATGEGALSLFTLLKNAVFLAKTLPVAAKRAEYHFKNAIELADEIGAKGIMGKAYLELGLLYKARKAEARAKQYILKAIQVFEETRAEVWLEQARQAMESLSKGKDR